jgi:uncharacterized membrane-anchored protein
MSRFLNLTFVALLAFALANSALAQSSPMSDEQRKAVWDAANAASINGPTDIKLRDQAVLHLPSHYAYVPQKESAALMHMWGNNTGPGFEGLVFDQDPNVQWTIAIDHVAEGYVKDDDAKTWNADELLQSLKDGTEAQNAERISMGIPALDIIGWVQPPSYDSSKHQLVWSLKAVDRGAAADAPSTINFNTYSLGRDGYFEINLMTSDKTINQDKAAALAVVGAVEYLPGKRYEDFNAGTDNVAAYGLAALVGGVAAKKLGLLALIGVFFAKFAKIILVGLAVAGGGLFKFFRRKSRDT